MAANSKDTIPSPGPCLGRCLPATLAIALVGCAVAACGVSERSDALETETPASVVARAPEFAWPTGNGSVAVVSIPGMGEIRIALYPELAPKTVENFRKLAAEDFYAGTTFHRVIPGFMIQGGSPASRDTNTYNDGQGDPGYTIADEFSQAPHLRGVVAMANIGKANTAGSQFFIVHADRTELDGKYSVFGRVIDGLEVVDAVTQVEIDKAGRWGSPDRPIEKVVIEDIRIEPGRSGHAGATPPSEPTS